MATVPAPAKGTWFDLTSRTERELGPDEEVPELDGFLWLDLEYPAPDALAALVRQGTLPAFAIAEEIASGDVTWEVRPDGVQLWLAGARLHGDSLILDRLRVIVSHGLVASLHHGRPGQQAALRARYGAVFPPFARSHGFLLYEIAGMVADGLLAVVRALGDRIDLLRLSGPGAGDPGETGSELIGSVLLLRRILVRTRDLLGEISSRRLEHVPDTTQPYLRDVAARLDGLLADLAFSRDVLSETLRAFDARRPAGGAAPAGPPVHAPAPALAPAATAARPPMRLATLGRFTVERAGEIVPDAAFGQGAARELLAALLCGRGEVAQADLVRWLWPALDAAGGDRALQSAVAELRRALEPELAEPEPSRLVAAGAGRLRLDLVPADDWDARELLATPARAAAVLNPEERLAILQRGLELHRGPLLPAWPYAEWGAALREECEAAHLAVRAALGEVLLQAGRPGDAVEHFELLLTVEPDGERWHRGLMRAHFEAGRRPVALRQYHACRSALRQSRGQEPDQQTQALYMELLRS